jgi:uncharacterized protein YebE (UPF0316 family)
MEIFAGFDWYAWVILPLLIFASRVCDVTLGTFRIIFISRGKRNLAPIFGFFEVLIWIVVIGQLVQHLHSVTAYLGYAAGFATGNFVGMWLEDRLALGTLVLRVIIPKDADELVERIRMAGFGITCVDGQGASGPVKLIYTVVKRKDLPVVTAVIHQTHPHAFISIEDVRSTKEGVFPPAARQSFGLFWGRKAK